MNFGRKIGDRGIARIDSVIARFDAWKAELKQGMADIEKQMVTNDDEMRRIRAEQEYLASRSIEAAKIIESIETLKGAA